MTFWAVGGVLLLIALLFSGEKRTNTTNSRKEAAHWIYHPHVIEEDDYECSEVFLGISLANEKDLILIVAPTEKKTEMIRQIMQDAGLDTGTGAIVFSLPVTDTAGMTLLPQSEELEENDLAEAAPSDASTSNPAPES